MPAPLDNEALARGLLALADAAGAGTLVERELGELAEWLSRNEEWRRFAADPAVQPRGKAEALDRLLRERVHPVLRHTVLTLLELEGLDRLPGVTKAYFAARAAQVGAADGELVASVEPTPEQVAAIRAEASRLLGRPVSLRVRVDARLLGGLRLQVGDIVIDDTIDSRLEAYRRQLASA